MYLTITLLSALTLSSQAASTRDRRYSYEPNAIAYNGQAPNTNTGSFGEGYDNENYKPHQGNLFNSGNINQFGHFPDSNNGFYYNQGFAAPNTGSEFLPPTDPSTFSSPFYPQPHIHPNLGLPPFTYHYHIQGPGIDNAPLSQSISNGNSQFKGPRIVANPANHFGSKFNLYQYYPNVYTPNTLGQSISPFNPSISSGFYVPYASRRYKNNIPTSPPVLPNNFANNGGSSVSSSASSSATVANYTNNILSPQLVTVANSDATNNSVITENSQTNFSTSSASNAIENNIPFSPPLNSLQNNTVNITRSTSSNSDKGLIYSDLLTQVSSATTSSTGNNLGSNLPSSIPATISNNSGNSNFGSIPSGSSTLINSATTTTTANSRGNNILSPIPATVTNNSGNTKIGNNNLISPSPAVPNIYEISNGSSTANGVATVTNSLAPNAPGNNDIIPISPDVPNNSANPSGSSIASGVTTLKNSLAPNVPGNKYVITLSPAEPNNYANPNGSSTANDVATVTNTVTTAPTKAPGNTNSLAPNSPGNNDLIPPSAVPNNSANPNNGSTTNVVTNASTHNAPGNNDILTLSSAVPNNFAIPNGGSIANGVATVTTASASMDSGNNNVISPSSSVPHNSANPNGGQTTSNPSSSSTSYSLSNTGINPLSESNSYPSITDNLEISGDQFKSDNHLSQFDSNDNFREIHQTIPFDISMPIPANIPTKMIMDIFLITQIPEFNKSNTITKNNLPNTNPQNKYQSIINTVTTTPASKPSGNNNLISPSPAVPNNSANPNGGSTANGVVTVTNYLAQNTPRNKDVIHTSPAVPNNSANPNDGSTANGITNTVTNSLAPPNPPGNSDLIPPCPAVPNNSAIPNRGSIANSVATATNTVANAPASMVPGNNNVVRQSPAVSHNFASPNGAGGPTTSNPSSSSTSYSLSNTGAQDTKLSYNAVFSRNRGVSNGEIKTSGPPGPVCLCFKNYKFIPEYIRNILPIYM